MNMYLTPMHHLVTKEIQESLVSRMMQDAVRRKASREKLLQAKIEQEMREVIHIS